MKGLPADPFSEADLRRKFMRLTTGIGEAEARTCLRSPAGDGDGAAFYHGSGLSVRIARATTKKYGLTVSQRLMPLHRFPHRYVAQGDTDPPYARTAAVVPATQGKVTRSAAWMFWTALMAAVIQPVCAQDLPNKVIRIVTAEAGGGNDLMSRLIANGLTRSLGQAVIVENRVPVSVVGELVAKAVPDGSTLLSMAATSGFCHSCAITFHTIRSRISRR